jgi:flagellum-specific ATP synthase
VNIGAYERGSNPRIDYALSMIDKVKAFLRQSIEEHFSFEETLGALGALFEEA